ncbi:hypothetical protein BDP27DRAFT_1245456 [Rhodocollybia butyracea]|uniref:DDE Tnp4 domain-containing protein n=1 Tax=Rhodocollybia butyracea TaxID=206335 RepID=A0A9P5P2G2_9AGAR|nr:hypothetical protein BDP27DRAFT_1245456 [Rhodocollybia butyracea]
MCRTGLSVHHIGEQFQHTGTTVSNHYKKILFLLSTPQFYSAWVKPPALNSPVPKEIRDEPKWTPFFDSVIGAIDGTHINCCPSVRDLQLARNWKGGVMQNCLAVVSMDM